MKERGLEKTWFDRKETDPNLIELKKIEKLKPPQKIKELAEKIIAANGALDQASFGKIIEVNKLLEEKRIHYGLHLLYRMVGLSAEPDAKKLVEDWEDFLSPAKHFCYERTTIKKWFNNLFSDKKFNAAKEMAKETEKNLEEEGINFKSNWDFAFRISPQKIKILSLEKGNLKKLLEEYNLPKEIDDEGLINFLYSPSDWKKGVLSRDFKEKIKDFKIGYNSISELMNIYKRIESRKFRKQREIVLERKEEIKKRIAEMGDEKINISDFEKVLSSLRKE